MPNTFIRFVSSIKILKAIKNCYDNVLLLVVLVLFSLLPLDISGLFCFSILQDDIFKAISLKVQYIS